VSGAGKQLSDMSNRPLVGGPTNLLYLSAMRIAQPTPNAI
jgi:hypothetical protein